MSIGTTLRNAEKLANLMAKPDDQKTFEQMAHTWEKLANDRERDLQPDD
jgi:hypothetical protein